MAVPYAVLKEPLSPGWNCTPGAFFFGAFSVLLTPTGPKKRTSRQVSGLQVYDRPTGCEGFSNRSGGACDASCLLEDRGGPPARQVNTCQSSIVQWGRVVLLWFRCSDFHPLLRWRMEAGSRRPGARVFPNVSKPPQTEQGTWQKPH